MPKKVVITFAIDRSRAQRYFEGFLDMLRYDQATVVEATPSVIVLRMEGHRPTEGRWQSMGLHILAQSEGDYISASVAREAATRISPSAAYPSIRPDHPIT